MDLIMTAIVGALAKIGEKAVLDSYNAFKALLKKKFGSKSDVLTAVAQLEKKPDSEGRQAVLEEELESVGALENAELVQTAKELLEQLSMAGSPQTIVKQKIVGDHNIFSGSGDVKVTSRQ